MEKRTSGESTEKRSLGPWVSREGADEEKGSKDWLWSLFGTF